MEKKKKFRIALAIFVSIILTIAVVFLILYHNGKKAVDDIVRIEVVVNYGYLYPTREYEIDFYSKKVTHKSEDEEIRITHFTEEEAEYFVEKANLYGFFNWKDKYISTHDVQDGKFAIFTIEFANGTTQMTDCYADFPITYDKMREVFLETFGYDML